MSIPPPPRPNRADMVTALKPYAFNKPSQISTSALTGPVYNQAAKKDHGIFDIPIVGPLIDWIDTPRAMIVSGIKELGDIGKDDQTFSISEWVQQSRDNMLMMDVLRDWEVDLPGWAEFGLGLTLDIAADPLTYMAGAGLLARAAKPATVANALMKAAKLPQNAARSADMLAAAQKVNRTGSILSAGKYLDDIGISSGARFTIPGTGKIGRTIIEKPLRTIFPVIGRKLDDMRVRQFVLGVCGDGAMKQNVLLI